jgi:uncharacterized protein (TIGR01244 family)
MQLPIRALNDDVSVAPQMGPEDAAQVAAAGFRSVVNNRPDYEHGPDQPSSAEVEAAVRALGLEFHHLPVAGGYQTPQQIAAMAELLQQLPKPVLMYCRSGSRSANLYAQACLLG